MLKCFRKFGVTEILIAISIAIMILYFLLDQFTGWQKSVVTIKDKLWNDEVSMITDSDGKISSVSRRTYILMCDVGKMQTNHRVYMQAQIGKSYVVLLKDVRIKEIIREDGRENGSNNSNMSRCKTKHGGRFQEDKEHVCRQNSRDRENRNQNIEVERKEDQSQRGSRHSF